MRSIRCFVTLRQKLDDGNLVADDQAVRPRQCHAARQGLFDRRQKPKEHERHQQSRARVSDRAELLPSQIAPDEMEEFHFNGSSAQLAFVQINRPRRARRGVRIVRDHDDGLAVFAVQRLEQIQDFVAGLAVQVAGRLVAQAAGWGRSRWRGRCRPAAVRRPRACADNVWRGAASPTTASAVSTCFFRSALHRWVSSSGNSTFRSAVSTGMQIVELEHKPDVPRAPGASCRSESWSIRSPAHRARILGWGGPARRSDSAACSCPNPTAPSAREIRRAGTCTFTSASTWMSSAPRWKTFSTRSTRTSAPSPVAFSLMIFFLHRRPIFVRRANPQ